MYIQKFNHSIIKKSLLISTLPLFLYYSPMIHAGGGDIQCSPHSTILNNQYDACNNLPILDPANDNQTNILLLLSDLGLAHIKNIQADTNVWDANEGTVPFSIGAFTAQAENKIPNQRIPFKSSEIRYEERCTTLIFGKTAFNQQIKNNPKISSTERQLLIAERNKIDQCAEKIALIKIEPNWSTTARQYASYLNASISFYNAHFSTATNIYTVLAGVDDAWLKETSQYMLIRVRLNSAFATAINQYGDVDLDKIDQAQLKLFLDEITSYLKLYPNGQYAASARGYMRRGFWLTDRQDLLVNEIVWQINHPKSKLYNLEIDNLPAEIDRRIFSSRNFNVKNLKDPFFLAIYDLMFMRKNDDKDYKPISWSELSAQKEYFKTHPELFNYLQATHLFFIQNKAKEALNYLPPANPSSINNSLQLSQVVLRGRILEKTTTPASAEKYWDQRISQAKTTYQRTLFEFALAEHIKSQQQYQAFIGQPAKISQANIQRIFITEHANESSLQRIVQASNSTGDQKNTALYTLLNKSLAYQNFSLFNSTLMQLPKDAAQYKYYESSRENLKNQPPFSNFIWNGTTISATLKCPSLSELTTKLAQNPKDSLLNVCLGEYFRTSKNYDLISLSYDENPSFNGQFFARGQVYKHIIQNMPKGDLHAYALYRAIQCYAPSGMNDCQDKDAPQATRKQWFDQIKRDYPDSSWAKSLKVYW